MTETNRPAGSGIPLSGKMFLYERPEALTHEDHGELGFTPSKHPFNYVKNVTTIPLTLTEFFDAQRHYPIVFSDIEKPTPLAITGVIDQRNLFVDDQGQWDPAEYVPSYLRCYPFAIASGHGKHAAVVDLAAETVTENPKFPFFRDGKVTDEAQALLDFCATYEGERQRTRSFCHKLAELGLLERQQATYRAKDASEPQPIANYISVSTKKLNDLGADVIHEMHKKGELAAVYMHQVSLQRWRHLMLRRLARTSEVSAV